MEPEQCPGGSGPPNIQTTADGQLFTEGSETTINLPIIPPLLDLSAENREMPKLSPTLDGPEIKEKNIEVITDIDEHQRIYISDLRLELGARPEAPFELDHIVVISAIPDTDKPIQLKRISLTIWKQVDASTSLARGDITFVIQSKDGNYEAIFFLGKEELTELFNKGEETKSMDRDLAFGDSTLVAKISFQIGLGEVTDSVFRQGVEDVVDPSNAGWVFDGRSLHIQARFVRPDAIASLTNVKEAMEELQIGRGSPGALLEALIGLPDNLPGKSTLLGSCGGLILEGPGDQLPKLNTAISAFKMRRELRLANGNQSNNELELDFAEARAYRQRFDRTQQQSDLDCTIEILEAITSAQIDEKGLVLSALDFLIALYWQRTNMSNDLADVTKGVAVLQRFVANVPRGHPNLPGFFNDLGVFLGTRFHRKGDINDLEEAISSNRRAVEIAPDGHEALPLALNSLANSLGARFHRTGDIHDLEEAISSNRRAVEIIPADGLPSTLNNLGNWLGTRFIQTGDIHDLEEAISSLRRAVEIAPADHSDLSKFLSNLGNKLWTCFNRTGNMHHLEEAISSHRRAIESTPVGHPSLPMVLNNLGSSLGTRFSQTGDIHDLEGAISSTRHATQIMPTGHQDLPKFLSNLGSWLSFYFNRTGDIHDLEEGISSARRAIEIAPTGHQSLPSALNNLGNCLWNRFNLTGDLNDLNEAILSNRHAIKITPKGHLNLPSRFHNLANGLGARFNQAGDIHDLEEAISSTRHAIQIMPAGHPDLPTSLSNLGDWLSVYFNQTGDIRKLEEAILFSCRAIEISSDGHPGLPAVLNGLGNGLHARFNQTGDIHNLNEAVASYRRIIEIMPVGHSGLPKFLSNLGCCLWTRFNQTGDIHDLEEAISSTRHAIQIMPVGHPFLPLALNNLGNGLWIRFERTGDIYDLEEAILRNRTVVEITPAGHPELPKFLNNLGGRLWTRFNRTGDIHNLEESILISRRAIKIIPDGHLDLSLALNNLGYGLCTRFNQTGDIHDLNEAILSHRRTIEITPAGHPNLPRFLINLGNGLGTHFNKTGDIHNLEEAISSSCRAIEITPDGHPDLSLWLNTLGTIYQYQGPQAYPFALSAFRNAALTISAPLSIRLIAARSWARVCHTINPAEFETPFRLSMSLLAELIGFEHPIELHYDNLSTPSASNLAAEAAASAFSYLRPDLALEWLEQGRCLVWSQLNQLRSPLAELQAIDNELAQEFQQLSCQLEQASHRQRSHLEDNMAKKISLQKEADQHRHLAKQHSELLDKIHKLPGFEHLLQPHPASYFLDNLPSDGPIVLINAHKERCDAIALIKGCREPLHVPLPEITLERVIGLQKKLQNYVGLNCLRMREHSHRDIGLAKTINFKDIYFVLERLWVCLVKPILDALGFTSSPTTLCRIWWCPTGPFTCLPIHAAGIYNADETHSLLDYAVSSYIPTVTTLIEKKKSWTASNGVFLISQAKAPGLSEIPGADNETDTLSNMMQKQGIPYHQISGPAATVQNVKEKIRSYSAIHLACHGSQNMGKPLESGFYLQDQNGPNGEPQLGCLCLSEIIKENLPNADFAFLSACQTSTGDQTLSDEAVHLAAGMLAAVYHSVVGTMWSIEDQYGQFIAEEFYKNLLERSTVDGVPRLHGSQAAYALHHAVKCLYKEVHKEVGDAAHKFLA